MAENKEAENKEAECERCKRDSYVPHNNCIYGGSAWGHSKTHCTASACF